jgi:hypothetical protein
LVAASSSFSFDTHKPCSPGTPTPGEQGLSEMPFKGIEPHYLGLPVRLETAINTNPITPKAMAVEVKLLRERNIATATPTKASPP